MNFLILGKNSYLGQKIGNTLKEEGHKVEWLTHQKTDDIPDDTITFEDFIKLSYKEKPTDIIINCAVSYGKNGESCCDMIGANLLYPLAILEWAAKNNVKQFINTATSITSLINNYTLSKNQFSEWGKLQSEHSSVQFINVVLEHFMGPNCSDNNFVSMLIHKMSKNIPYIDLTSGMQLRDFIYIDDVVEAYMCIIHHIPHIYDSYIEIPVGSGIPYRIKEICEQIKYFLKSKTELRFGYLPYREHEIMYSCADNTQLRKWGWNVRYSLEEAIKLIIEKENIQIN